MLILDEKVKIQRDLMSLTAFLASCPKESPMRYTPLSDKILTKCTKHHGV